MNALTPHLIWIKLAAVVALCALSAWAASSYTGAQKDTAISKLKADHARATSAATVKALAETTRMQKDKDHAIEQAQIRAQANARAAAAAGAERDRLRKQLASDRFALPGAACGSVREYTSTLNAVFGECADRLVEVARAADGHAVDAMTCFNAWPRGAE